MVNQLIRSKYYCGVDLHARRSTICVMDAAENLFLNIDILMILLFCKFFLYVPIFTL